MSAGEEPRIKSRVPEFLHVPWGIRHVLLFIGLYIISQVMIGVVFALLAPVLPPVAGFVELARKGDIGATFGLYLLSTVLGLGLTWLLIRKHKPFWRLLGWRKVNLWRAVLWVAIFWVAFWLLATVALLLAGVFIPGFDPMQPQDNQFIKGVGTNANLALIALVLLPPIFEETIFRGFVFPALSKRIGLVWGAVLSSLFFGLAHGQPNIFVYTMILGLISCFMYVRFRSIIPGVMLHMVNNLLAFLVLAQG